MVNGSPGGASPAADVRTCEQGTAYTVADGPSQHVSPALTLVGMPDRIMSLSLISRVVRERCSGEQCKTVRTKGDEGAKRDDTPLHVLQTRRARLLRRRKRHREGSNSSDVVAVSGVQTTTEQRMRDVLLLAGDANGSVSFWNVLTRARLICIPHAHGMGIGVVGVSSLQHLRPGFFMSCGRDGFVRGWDLVAAATGNGSSEGKSEISKGRDQRRARGSQVATATFVSAVVVKQATMGVIQRCMLTDSHPSAQFNDKKVLEMEANGDEGYSAGTTDDADDVFTAPSQSLSLLSQLFNADPKASSGISSGDESGLEPNELDVNGGVDILEPCRKTEESVGGFLWVDSNGEHVSLMTSDYQLLDAVGVASFVKPHAPLQRPLAQKDECGVQSLDATSGQGVLEMNTSSTFKPPLFSRLTVMPGPRNVGSGTDMTASSDKEKHGMVTCITSAVLGMSSGKDRESGGNMRGLILCGYESGCLVVWDGACPSEPLWACQLSTEPLLSIACCAVNGDTSRVFVTLSTVEGIIGIYRMIFGDYDDENTHKFEDVPLTANVLQELEDEQVVRGFGNFGRVLESHQLCIHRDGNAMKLSDTPWYLQEDKRQLQLSLVYHCGTSYRGVAAQADLQQGASAIRSWVESAHDDVGGHVGTKGTTGNSSHTINVVWCGWDGRYVVLLKLRFC